MIKYARLIILCVIAALAKADLCSDNFTINDFPDGIREQAIGLILFGTINFGDCPANTPPVTEDEVKFFLYNRDNPEVPILLDPINPVQVDSNKPIKILIHGWTCSVNGYGIPEIRRAYLQRYDCNVIGVDWSARSVDLFTSAYCAMRGVSQLVTTFLIALQDLYNVDLTQQVHIVGHSMGAQIAGYIGQEIQERLNKSIVRITGLDPEGPISQFKPPTERLDLSDAKFVEVIHSNGGILGYFNPCGHADFFPNCGSYQYGCPKFTTYEQIANVPITFATCNHFRSCLYFAESIIPVDKIFAAVSCQVCPVLPIPEICPADLLNRKYNVMGEDCASNSPARKFQLRTNAQSPFARGYSIFG